MRTTKNYEIELDAAPRERNIFIFMDGTWNDETGRGGSGLVTNVVKLYRCLATDSESQISRYFRGVGNDEEYGAFGGLMGGGFGANEKKIREEAYSVIAKEYRPGDKIHIFGFSRGAASARMLAAELAKNGIPKHLEIKSTIRENRSTHNLESKFISYKSSGPTKEVEVEFLGCFDTVGAFGIPMNILGLPLSKWNLFKDMHVSPIVKKAVHTLAMDETRDPFSPTLMNYKPGVVEEVWFPGVHSDMGGSIAQDRLGRSALRFMVDRLKKHTAAYANPPRFDEKLLEEHIRFKDEDDFIFSLYGIGYKKSMRKIFVQRDDKPDESLRPQIHKSVRGLQESRRTKALVSKKPLFGKKVENFIRVLYNPWNLGLLNKEYDIVE